MVLESTSQNKKVFAIMTLTHILKQKLIQPGLLIITVMILLNDDSLMVRQQTFHFIESLLAIKDLEDNEDHLSVFTQVQKP